MDKRQPYAEHDPRHHVVTIRDMLTDTMNHARADESKVSDPKAQALFETTAEVLGGLIKAYDDFEHKSEPVWQ